MITFRLDIEENIEKNLKGLWTFDNLIRRYWLFIEVFFYSYICVLIGW